MSMVGWLIALILAGVVAWVFLRQGKDSGGGKGSNDTSALPPSTPKAAASESDETRNTKMAELHGGKIVDDIGLITSTVDNTPIGFDVYKLSNAVATSAGVDPSKLTTNDRGEILARAKGFKDYDQMYAAKQTLDVETGHAQAAAISERSVAAGGPAIDATNSNMSAALTAAGPTGPQPPGTYWDYAAGKWAVMYF